jgi:hypothetical protein
VKFSQIYFLEAAHHLLKEGYKDPAAVLAGGVLEEHLRQLGTKHGVKPETSANTGLKMKEADQLNAELTKAGAYSKLDQKNVTAWLALRNKAAHGQYSEYKKGQVSLMLSGVREFLTGNPA